MGIILGQPQKNKDEARKGHTDFVDLKDGENVHRILYGPVRRSFIWYPTLRNVDGELQLKKKMVIRPDEGCILDEIAAIEKKIRMDLGEDQPQSSLRPVTRYFYLIMDQNRAEPLVEIARYPYQVFNDLITKEEEVDTDDPTKLRYGLIFMFKWIIKKSIDPSKQRRYGVTYSAEPDPKSVAPFVGKVPVAALGQSPEELMAIYGDHIKSIFTEAEWEAMNNCNIELEKELKPHTPDQIVNMLIDSPIFLDAKDGDNYIFPSRESFNAAIIELGLKTLREGNQAALPPAPKSVSPTEVDLESPTETVQIETSPPPTEKTSDTKWELDEEVEEGLFQEPEEETDKEETTPTEEKTKTTPTEKKKLW